MANIRPFRAIRPAPGYEKRIAALPYDVCDSREAARQVEQEPLSFLGIDRAEVWFGAECSPYADCVYEKAGSLLRERVREGVFLREVEPCFYLYELTRQGHAQTGVAALFPVDDYLTGAVARHENTRAEKEEDRVRHVTACGAQTGPVFLAYRDQGRVKEAVAACKNGENFLCGFVSDDGIGHRLWRVRPGAEADALREAFGTVGRLYIADGHHRCAAAVRYALEKRRLSSEERQRPGQGVGKVDGASGQGDAADAPWNWVLSVMFPAGELEILPYNRAVRDLNGLGRRSFLQKVEESFHVSRLCPPGPPSWEKVRPLKRGEFALLLSDGWYRLTAAEGIRSGDPVGSLDVSLLQERLLAPVLGIGDPRTDHRIRFVGGIGGPAALERCLEEGMEAAFWLYPTQMEELLAVADSGRLMPPKSTWFEPKLRSGLLIYPLVDLA